MTLIEAVETGMPIKRKDWESFKLADDFLYLSLFDILANDWEIKSNPIVWKTEIIRKAGFEFPVIKEHSKELFENIVYKKVRVTVEVID